MIPITYFSFAVSPVLIVLAILYLKFKFSISNLKNIRNAIIFGALSVILLVIANYLVQFLWHGDYKNMRRLSFFVFIVIAFSSELGKFIPLKGYFYKFNNFGGPLESVIYSIFISLGFSTVSTLLYAYGIIGIPEKMNNFTIYLYTLPLANIVFAVIMGFFIGMGKLRKSTFVDTIIAIFVATFFHGLYYFGFITHDIRLLIFIGIGFVIMGITFIVKSVTIKLEY